MHYSSWATLVSELPSGLSVCVYASAFVCMHALVLNVGHPEIFFKENCTLITKIILSANSRVHSIYPKRNSQKCVPCCKAIRCQVPELCHIKLLLTAFTCICGDHNQLVTVNVVDSVSIFEQ